MHPTNDRYDLMLAAAKMKKNILILTSEMGQGHMSAARGIQEGLELAYGKTYNIEIVNFIEFLNKKINKVSKKTYEKLASTNPFIVNFLFERWNKKSRMKLLNILNYPMVYRKIKQFFLEKKPDLIISTYPLWDHLTVKLLKKYNPRIPFISVITDSTIVHEAWTTAEVDYHIVPDSSTAKALEEQKIHPKKIKTFGFPIKKVFFEPINRQKFLESMNLDPKNFTILLIAVSQKKGKNIKTVDQIRASNPDSNIIIICGRDHHLLSSFEKLGKEKNTLVLGWTDQMPNFIKSSDIVITKAGGATIMECIAAAKPVIITKTIARHELGNAQFVTKRKLGVFLKRKNSNIATAINEIREDYDSYLNNLNKASKPKASLEIAQFVHKLLR